MFLNEGKLCIFTNGKVLRIFLAGLMIAFSLLSAACGADGREIREGLARGKAGGMELPDMGGYRQDGGQTAAYLREHFGLDNLKGKPKVILDCDMTFMGDDAMAMCILVQADSIGLIDLLGITVTGGNSCVAAGTNAALKQLELIGRSDIPVYMGTDEPVCGFRDIGEQEKIIGQIQHWGLLYSMDDYVEPSRHHDLGAFYDRKLGYSETEPQTQASVDFMIGQCRKYPGEVTIVSTGPVTNIALACLGDADFAGNISGVIYVGTVLDESGSYTPFADFNCFYDARAFEICLQSGFKRQWVIPHDLADQAKLDKAVFDLLFHKNRTPVSALWLEQKYGLYKRDVTKKDSCLDAIAAAVFLDSLLVTEWEEHYITINTDIKDEKYGGIVIHESADGGNGAVKVDFAGKVDTGKYWDFVTDLMSLTWETPLFFYTDCSAQEGG